MTPFQIVSAIKVLVSIRQPVFLWGPPGVGKSQIVAQTAAEMGYELKDIRAVMLDPVDLRGIPRITPGGKTQWCAPSFLPAPGEASRGILFLDELNTAPPLVQAACYQLILDRRIGEYVLPEGWVVIAAGNREQDRSVTHRMPTALANRMVHLEIEVSTEDWLLWADGAGIRPEVSAFIRFRPKLLHDFDPRSASKAFATPRSWAFVSAILDAAPAPSVEYDLYRGTVGDAAAAEFSGFLDSWRELPAISEILAHPDSAAVPEEPAALYALCGSLAEQTDKNDLPAVLEYLSRVPAEFAVLFLRQAVLKDRTLVETDAFGNWAMDHADILM